MLQSRIKRFAAINFFACSVIVLKVAFPGQILGFDFGLFQPDGAYYAFEAFKFLGENPVTAFETIRAFYEEHSYSKYSLPQTLDAFTSTNAFKIVQSRPLYPFLSIPFLGVIGLWGMLAIPIISLIASINMLQFIAEFAGKARHGVCIIGVLLSSITLSRWTILNYSDSLNMMIFSVFLFLTLKRKNPQAKYYSIILILIFLSSLTRFVLPYWISISIVYILNKQRKMGYTILLASIATILPSMNSKENIFYFIAEQTTSERSILSSLYNSLKITISDFSQLLLMDKLLFFLLITSFVITIQTRSNLYSQLLFATFIASWSYTVAIGVVGTNFRYWLPCIPFAFYVLITNINFRFLRAT